MILLAALYILLLFLLFMLLPSSSSSITLHKFVVFGAMGTYTNSGEDDITDSALVDEFKSERNSSSGSLDFKKGAMNTHTNSEDDDITDSVLVDEFKTERNSSSGSLDLKKGPWSEEEDAILKAYVVKNGQGNWNAVQRFSGLSRCGKSCRLRWTNHLKPDLKKGPFSPEEERKVIELHAQIGPKWARIAVALPGRTDNEIKNFWNTRCKRLQRAGIPIYPPDMQVSNQTENQQSPETPPFSNGNIPSPHGFLDTGYNEIQEFKIPKNPLLRNHSSPAFLDVSLLLQQVPQPNPYYNISNMFSAIHPQGPVPVGNSNYMSVVPLNPQDMNGYQTFNNIYPTVGLSDPLRASGITPNGGLTVTGSTFPAHSTRVPNVNGVYPISNNPAPAKSFNASTHAVTNGFSFIEPSYESTLLELPSIQNSVSGLSFMDHIHIHPPQAGPSTHQESTDPAEKFADEVFNDPLETYTQHDALPENAQDVAVSNEDIQQVETNDDVFQAGAGTELVPRPMIPDTDISDPNEWLNESLLNFYEGPEYTLLDQEMSAFISDEDLVNLATL